MEAEDDFADDAFLEQYRQAGALPNGCMHRHAPPDLTCACRQRRLAELSASASAPHFSTVMQIDKAQFVAEVTQASEDLWVVVHLYKDKCAPRMTCLRLAQASAEHRRAGWETARCWHNVWTAWPSSTLGPSL